MVKNIALYPLLIYNADAYLKAIIKGIIKIAYRNLPITLNER